MEELLACRVCLITDVKLFDMLKNNLAESFEMFTGWRMSLEGRPRHICSICATLLLKSVSFMEKCNKAQNILTRALKKHRRLTTARLRNIDRSRHSLHYPLTTETVKENYVINEVEVPYPMKEEYLEDSDFEDREIDTYEMLFKYESDEFAALINKEGSNESENSNHVEEEQQIEEMYKSDEEPLAKVKEKEISLKDSGEELKNSKNNAVVLSKDQVIEEVLKNQVINLNSNNEPLEHDSDEEVMTEEQLKNSNVDVMVVVFSKEQQIERVQARKNSSNYLNSPHRCDKCFKGFLTRSSFDNHMAKHDPARGAHECYACFTRWRTKTTLLKHTHRHERQYRCLKCDHVSKTGPEANMHGKWHRGVKYTCHICGATFNKPTTRLSHVRLKHPAHPSHHRCDLCGDSFLGERGVAFHKLMAHRHQSGERRSGAVPAADEAALCGACGAQFRDAAALRTHAAAAGDKPCDSLRPCATCGEGFSSEEALAKHSHTHKGQRAKCQECDKWFVDEYGYAAHFRRAHLGVRHASSASSAGHVCEVCGRKCISAAALSYHQLTHSGEKPHACPECPKRFRIREMLKLHQRVHSGERPFECAECPKAFKAKGALRRHELVHSGKKPFTCQCCGRGFSQSNSLKGHVLAVHGAPLSARPRRAARHRSSAPSTYYGSGGLIGKTSVLDRKAVGNAGSNSNPA